MKIGFVNIYSFRPHVEHLFYLHDLLKEAGHETFFLTCDASVSNCYARSIKATSKLKECSQCIIGNVRSYPVANITSISSKIVFPELSSQELDDLTLSSSCTLTRTESDHEQQDAEVIAIRKSLQQPVLTAYRSAMKWIDDNQLDAVICFNGRMDLTRAVIYASEQSGIPYITHERTWFGDGLHLVPNGNCLSLGAIGNMVKEFDDKLLKREQARLAGKLIALRFLQQNTLEWRLYNKNANPIDWPTKSTGRKVLVLPSSRNEFAGHNDWKNTWPDNTQALDDFFDAFSVSPEDVVVRFHPNWAEKIGRVTGERALRLYTNWARRKGVYYISSEEKANTYNLIQQADIVVMNGGSSTVEAGACGKQVICLGPSTYQQAGFVRTFMTKEELYQPKAKLDIEPDDIIRKTLRYVYLHAKRFPQYVDYVKAIKTTEYRYFAGADPDRIIQMLHTGKLEADDAGFSQDHSGENEVVELLKQREWRKLAEFQDKTLIRNELPIRRRFGLRWLDGFRAMFALGDR